MKQEVDWLPVSLEDIRKDLGEVPMSPPSVGQKLNNDFTQMNIENRSGESTPPSAGQEMTRGRGNPTSDRQ